MASFQVQAPDGAYSTVSHREFFEVLNNGEGYLYYKQGGKHLAMQPTTSNIEALKACRQAENAENYGFAASKPDGQRGKSLLGTDFGADSAAGISFGK